MILRGWQCVEEPVGQRLPRRLPALLNGIEFGRVRRKMHYSECLLVGFQKLLNLSPPVPGGIVNNQENLAPFFLQLPQKSHKAALGFMLAE